MEHRARARERVDEADRDDYLGFRNGLSHRPVEDREIIEARGERELKEEERGRADNI